MFRKSYLMFVIVFIFALFNSHAVKAAAMSTWWVSPTPIGGSANPLAANTQVNLGFQVSESVKSFSFVLSENGGATWKTVSAHYEYVGNAVNYTGSFVLKIPALVGIEFTDKTGTEIFSPKGIRLLCVKNVGCPQPQFTYSGVLYKAPTDNSGLVGGTATAVIVPELKQTGCIPLPTQVAFFENGGNCWVNTIEDYVPLDKVVVSVKVGSDVLLTACTEINLQNCTEYASDKNITDLKSFKIAWREKHPVYVCTEINFVGCQALEVGSNTYSGQVKSIKYKDGYEFRAHVVLFPNLDGSAPTMFQTDTTIPVLDFNAAGVDVYLNAPPKVQINGPTNGQVFEAGDSIKLAYAGNAESSRVHVWSEDCQFELTKDWYATSQPVQFLDLPTNLQAGCWYFVEVKSRSIHPELGEGPSDFKAFFVKSGNTSPQVAEGDVFVNAGQTLSVHVLATDFDGDKVSLSAGSSSFATFTDNGDNTGTLTLSPKAINAGTYEITIYANDGKVSSSGKITVHVIPAPAPPPVWNPPTPTPTLYTTAPGTTKCLPQSGAVGSDLCYKDNKLIK